MIKCNQFLDIFQRHFRSPSLFLLIASMAAPVVIEANSKQTSSLIFLHGLGDTGHGWASSMAELKPPHTKVICPTADTMPVTLNGGYPMPSWFDLISLDVNAKEDEEGIKRAAQKVHSLIDKEVSSGIPSDRIVIGGFSQGGALALYSALTYPKKLAGVVALSCWLPMHKTFPAAATGNPNINTPFLQCHGDCDPIVPYMWGQLTSSLLKGFVKNVTFNTYQGLQHSSNSEEIDDIRNFVISAVPAV
uniref:palmitoyl-protein hydrolase n=2 Tax=Cacopsylla melanoneura TaxID=428564 RepID=A0A8D9ABH2_9HEMI